MSRDLLPAQAFDAAQLPLSGLRLIEASAGTGKTFSLAGLYLRLVIEKHVSVRDILVMTFTRAATQELRERIRARLVTAARIAQSPELARPGDPADALTQALIDNQHDEPRTALARRLADAASRIDEATIVTIHGFAQRAATENAFESALAFDRGDAIDDMTVYREATADYWRAHVFGERRAASDVLAFFDSPDALFETLREVFRRPSAALVGADRRRIADILATLTADWPATVAPLTDALVAATEADALRKNEALNVGLSAYATAADAVADLDGRVQTALAEDRLPALPGWVRALADPAGQCKSRPASAQRHAETLAGLPALALLAELQPLARLVAIEDAAAAIRHAAQRRKIAHREYSYDDLIVALHAALTDPRTGKTLADALYARWPYALVDEFQDTDPLQYESLARIYLETPRDTGALLLIGDPKQAIYGFRGGDIYAYLDAARAAGEARYTLTTNYRSTPAVLAAIEALYRLPDNTPFLVDDIVFPHVTAGRAADDRQWLDVTGAPQPAMTIWQLVGGEKHQKNGKTRNPPKPDDTARLIDETVAAIAALLSGQAGHWQEHDTTPPIAARDIAVLVNNHREATGLQRAMAARGIGAVCQQRDSVYASAEAADCQHVLRAMAAPDSAAAVRAAQPTPLIGTPLAELVAAADDDNALQSIIERFHRLFETWQRRGILAALELVFIAAAPRLLAMPDGARRMSNYLQLGELLAQGETECFGMDSLIHWLDTRIAAAIDGQLGSEDESQLRLESDADLVRISTVHAAKGLEYDIVFLPFALWLGSWSDMTRPDKPPLVFHPTDDMPRHPTASNSRAMIDLIGDNAAHGEQARLEARSEALRLFYVAATRARQALILGWRAPDDTGAPGALADLLHRRDDHDTNAPAHGLAGLKSLAGDVLAVREVDSQTPAPPVPMPDAATETALAQARDDLPTPRPRWSTYSFSRLAHAPSDNTPATLPEPGAADEIREATADETPTSGDTQNALPALDTRLTGVRFGSVVHDLLEDALTGEWADDESTNIWLRPDEQLSAERHAAVAAKLRQYGLVADRSDDPRIADTAALMARTLHTPLPEIGPLARLASNSLRTEMEFMLRLGGNRLGALVNTLRDAGYLDAPLGGHPGQTLYGLMQGFIDLVVAIDGRYYILDYKTNRLGETAQAYDTPALQNAMSRSHYDLQYLIYTVALHRHLRACLPDYDASIHLGGVQYLFVRAMDGTSRAGIYTDKPPTALIETLDRLFDDAEETAA